MKIERGSPSCARIEEPTWGRGGYIIVEIRSLGGRSFASCSNCRIFEVVVVNPLVVIQANGQVAQNQKLMTTS